MATDSESDVNWESADESFSSDDENATSKIKGMSIDKVLINKTTNLLNNNNREECVEQNPQSFNSLENIKQCKRSNSEAHQSLDKSIIINDTINTADSSHTTESLQYNSEEDNPVNTIIMKTPVNTVTCNAIRQNIHYVDKNIISEITVDHTNAINIDLGAVKNKTEKLENKMFEKQLEENRDNGNTDIESKEQNMWEQDDWGSQWTSIEETKSTKTKTMLEKTDNFKKDSLWGDDEGWGFDNVDENNIHVKEDHQLESTSVSERNNCPINNTVNKRWGDWSQWGINSMLSTAATLTTTVSQGLSTVLETGIGVPDPEELAKQHKQEEANIFSTDKKVSNASQVPVSTNSNVQSFGISKFVSGVSQITKLVESTSTKVISGGLDTLESIGKKTMEVLQENDPGLKRKTAFLMINQNKSVLSQILREAKERAEEENIERESQHIKKKANYEMIFDDYQGLVHLEALEMLSKQSEIKLDMMLKKCTNNDTLTDMKETLEQVKELCELTEDDDEENLNISEAKEKIENAVSEIGIPISYAKFFDTYKTSDDLLNEENIGTIHSSGLELLAHLTAKAVEQYHKAGEFLLIKEHRSTADEADSLVQLTSVIIAILGSVAVKFSNKLRLLETNTSNKDEVNDLITNIFYEAANSNKYVKNAFQLLIPVLQVGAM